MPLGLDCVSPAMSSTSSNGHAERVGHDLAPRGVVALAVRGGAGDDLDLAGGQHPDLRASQPPAP
jgi:hypothetical protein